jgi:hypothetical protein
MNNKQKAQAIKRDLEARFKGARFDVSVIADDVHVDFIGGDRHDAEFPDTGAAVQEMVKVIRKTIPGFEWMDYETPEGDMVYAEG